MNNPFRLHQNGKLKPLNADTQIFLRLVLMNIFYLAIIAAPLAIAGYLVPYQLRRFKVKLFILFRKKTKFAYHIED